MAVLPFRHQEFVVTNRSGFSIDSDNDMFVTSLDFDVAPANLAEGVHETLIVEAPDRYIGLQYEQRTVNVFENDLRVLGRKSIHSYFLTAQESTRGIYTHLTIIAADPNKYLAGPLGTNMKRVASGKISRYNIDARMRKLYEYAREF